MKKTNSHPHEKLVIEDKNEPSTEKYGEYEEEEKNW